MPISPLFWVFAMLYKGPTLLQYLESVEVDEASLEAPFRLPVQWVNRPNLDFRGFSGTIASGLIHKGDDIIVIPSGKRSRVKDIVTFDGSRKTAREDMAITLTLEDEIDISRGDMICKTDAPTEQADQFQAASITRLKHRVDINDFSEVAAKTLELNQIGVANISLSKPIAFDPYADNRQTGSFILIDRQTNATVGAGMLEYSLRRAQNVVWQDMSTDKDARAKQKMQKPALLWFTGLSGSGKSTIANLVDKRLQSMGKHTYTLDGDNVRHGLNRDLGFTKEDRIENIRRIGEVSNLMVDAGLITMASFISPYRQERQSVREMLEEGEFIEIYVDTPLEVAEKRDVKGLYKRARAGEIKNFTGIDSEYQAPENAEITINTVDMSAEDAAETIVSYLTQKGFLEAE